jgi:hypothetical protein
MKTIMGGAVILLSLVAAACGGKSEGPAAPAPGKAKTAAEAPKPTEGPKGPYIAAFRIGHDLTANGAVAVEGSVFGPGDTICVSFDIKNAPADGKVHLRWETAADKKTVREADVPLSADHSPNVSSKTETGGWPPGEYTLHKYLSAPSANIQNMELGTATAKIVRERPK